MIVRGYHFAAVLAGSLLASLLYAQYAFPPRTHKDMEADLTIEAGKRTPERGLGEVTLTLTVAGPLALDVEDPRLGDAAAAWKEERLSSTREVRDQRTVWSQVIRLKQVKGGVEPVPDVTLRFRSQPDADWIEEKWIDILRHVRIPPPQQPEEETPSWLRRWGFVLILAATSLLVLLAWLGKRRGFRHEAPLPPDQWALREFERIEKTLMPPFGEAEAYHTQISYVVRRYLAERFGLHALQQTTAEFLQAVRHVPQVTADHETRLHPSASPGIAIASHPRLGEEQQVLLGELFERCDLAKFARARAAPEACRRTVEVARDLVRQTSKE